ncbi:MAG: ATP-binding cassette domain-containing protein [Miltoncostaeaceae bacterium]
MPEPAVLTRGITRDFGELRAVDAVDLEIPEGEIFGFLGPNGAGKSTLVRMLVTLIAPSAGEATVAGADLVGDPDEVRLRIGVALQDAALDARQTGRELLRRQARLYGLTRAETDERMSSVLGLIDIGDAMDRQIGTYSGGMKRRLDLAAALVHNPRVLFLDEPTTVLDPVSRARVWEEVRRLNDEGMTVFLTTQYLDEADALADRVGIINLGELVAIGSPAALKRGIGSDVIVVEVDGEAEAAAPAVEGVRGVERVTCHGHELAIQVSDGTGAISPVAVALDTSGVPVRNLTLRTPTLDDVFFEHTGARIRSDEQSEAAE